MNNKYDEFIYLYKQNEFNIPNFSFKEGKGDLKLAVDATVNQFADIDPIETQSMPNGTVAQTDTEPYIKEDVASTGETIISDVDDDITVKSSRVDDAPAGVEVKTSEAVDKVGLSSFTTNPFMDDFLGEQEGNGGTEEEGDKDITPEEVIERKLQVVLDQFDKNTSNATLFEDASKILAEKIGAVYNNFKNNIVPEVKNLHSKIIDETNHMLNVNGSSQLAESLEIEAPAISMINWSDINPLGSKDEIIAKAKAFGKLKMTDVMNFNASRSTTTKWLPRLEEVNIPDAVGDNIVKKVATEVGENVEEAGIITASNPDTPEGQVAGGEAYIKRILSGNTLVSGTEGLLDGIILKIKSRVEDISKEIDELDRIDFSNTKNKISDKNVTGYNKKDFDKVLNVVIKMFNDFPDVCRSIEKAANNENYCDTLHREIMEKGKSFAQAIGCSPTLVATDDVNIKEIVDKNITNGNMKSLGYTPADIKASIPKIKDVYYKVKKFSAMKLGVSREASISIGWLIVFILFGFWLGILIQVFMNNLRNQSREQRRQLYDIIYTSTNMYGSCIKILGNQAKCFKAMMNSVGTESLSMDTEGNFEVDTIDTDKQAFAHSPEEALEEAKEAFTNTMVDRKVSGGVRLGNENIYKKFMDKMSYISDNINYNYLNNVNVSVLRKVDKKYLPLDKCSLFDKTLSFNMLNYLKDNVLNVKNLIIKLKHAGFEGKADPADIDSISNSAKKLHNELNTILKTDVAKTDNIFTTLYKNIKKSTLGESEWIAADIQKVMNYKDTFESYRVFKKDIENLYKMESLHDSNQNKVFNYGYYMVEMMNTLFSTIYSATMSTCMTLVSNYETGIRNSYDKSSTNMLFTPKMDDFLGENEGTENDNKDGNDHLESDDSAIESFNYNNLSVGKEGLIDGIILKIKSKVEDINTQIAELNDLDLSKINKNSLSTKTVSGYNKKQFDRINDAILNMFSEFSDMCVDIEKAANDEDFCNILHDKISKDGFEFAKAIDCPMSMISTDDSNVTKIAEKNLQSGTAKSLGYNTVADIKISIDKINDAYYKIKNFSTMKLGNAREADISVGWFIFFILFCFPAAIIQKLTNNIRNQTEKQRKQLYDIIYTATNMYGSSIKILGNQATCLKKIIESSDINDGKESRSVTREVYDIVSKHAGYYAFARKMNKAMRAMDTGHQVPEMLRVVNKYPKVLQKLATMDFGISLNDGNALKKNANSVREMLNCIGLHLLVCKQYFDTNNVLLLDATHANPDTFEEFKKQDGSMEDINLHLLHRYILPNQPVPNMGIRISEIIRNRQNVALEHMKRTESIKDKVRINHDGASALAYTRVLSDYLKTVPDNEIPKGMTRNNFVAMKYSLVKATSQYLNNKDHTVDECIYRFLLKLKYADKPMYQDMYNKMEIQYRRLAESADGAITPEDKATADAKVVSDIVMNFLFDYFVEK